MRGFTLLETVIYIALLTLIIGGTLAATYELLSGQARASGHNTTQEEGSFVLGKFAWAMGQIIVISTPSSGTTHNLDITTASGQVKFCLVGTAIVMQQGGGDCDAASAPLTTSNAEVTGLDFTYLPAVGGAPDGIMASTTINGETFRMTRYLRK